MVPHGRAGASEAALIRCSSVSPLKAVGVVKTRIARRGGAVPHRAAPTSNRRCCVTVPPRDTAPACVRPRRARAHCGGVATNSRRERAEMSWSPGCKDTGEDKARYDPLVISLPRRERAREPWTAALQVVQGSLVVTRNPQQQQALARVNVEPDQGRCRR